MVMATRIYVFLIVAILLAGCEPRYVNTDCWLPILRTDEPLRTIINVGDGNDRSFNTCPVPVARIFEAEARDGTVKFEWWGSPHKLYMSASLADGRPLDIRGVGIEVYEESGSWLAEYSHRRTFSGNNLLDKPASEPISIALFGADGDLLDTIQATYDTVRCSCPVPEGMGRPSDSR
jgi:hypothetical protein